jgi:hypothetical protein
MSKRKGIRGGGGYLKFLDNYAILTVEEGEIEASKIIENLQQLFDSKWQW